MSLALKVSGFIGLTIQMLWGMGFVYGLIQGSTNPGNVVAAHAHLGILSIAALVAGFAVDEFDVRGLQRTLTVSGFIAGQWLLPTTSVAGAFLPAVASTSTILWVLLLALSMAILAYHASPRRPATTAAGA